jgi:hypothetical protein
MLNKIKKLNNTPRTEKNTVIYRTYKNTEKREKPGIA